MILLGPSFSGRLCPTFPTRLDTTVFLFYPWPQQDARWWLVNSAEKTRIAIVIHITYKPADNVKSLLIENWQMADNPRRITQRSPPNVPALTINDQGVVDPPNSDLRIPYQTVFDIPPPIATDIIVTNAGLRALVPFIFNPLWE